MMMADTMDPSVSDSVCRTQIITDEDQTLRLSPRKPAFRKDVVFEKVCCMPSSSTSSSSSSVSTSKSSPGMQCGRRKASAGSPTDGEGQGGCSGSSSRPPCSRPPSSESQKACGRGICFKDSPSPNENESNGTPGPTGEEVSSSEPLGEREEEEEDEEGARELTLGEESILPDGVVNHSGSLSTMDRLADSDIIRRIKRGGGEGDDPSISSSSSGGQGIGDGGPRRASETINRPPESSPATKAVSSSSSRSPYRAAARALLVTDIDAVDGGGHLQAPSTAPSGRQERNREATPRTPATDVLWEFNGRRLSNFCQNLMTECVSLDDEEEEEEGGIGRIVPLGSVATTRETCVDDDDYGSWGRAPGRPTTPISTVGDDGGGLLLSNRVPSSLGYSSSNSSRMDDSGMASTGTTGEDEITENVSVRDRNSNTSTQRKVITIDNVKEKPSTKSAFTDARQGSGTITPPPCEEKTSPGKTGKDSEAARQGGRRGRTMERGKYEASLLKDFIRPDQKKFSIAPVPLHQDFSLDVELAIWEASDFVPDRHASAPPAVLPMRLANSEDVLRSRQTSVSPQRQRPSGGPGGPRAGKGSKSVELLSVRHASPSGAKIRRRTLSKEWQVFTFTTREEITTLIRPKTANEESRVEEAKRDEHNPTGFQNCHPTESNETAPPPPKDSGAQRSTKTDDRFANIASKKDHLFIAESSSGFPSADLPKPTGVDQRLSPESRGKSEATLPLLCPTDSPDSTSSSDVWEEISGALSDAMRHVRWAESAAPFEKTKSLSAESTYDNMAAAADGSYAELLLLSRSAAQSNNISSGNLSEPKEDNSEMCDQCGRNDSSPSMMEMDELVKALLDIANDNTVDSGASNRQQRPHTTVNESASFCLFEMTTGGEFLESGNENDFPFSRHRGNIPINDNNTQLRGVKVNRSAADNNNSSLIQNETDLSADEVAAKGNNINTTATTTTTTTTITATTKTTTNTTHLNRNALSPEIESAFDKSVLDRINCSVDDDDDDLIAVDNGDSILQISEELEIFEAGADPPLFESAEFLERIPAEQQVVDRTDDSAADGDNSCRRRVASKENGAKEVTSSSSRRAAEESAAEVFPEKAFLESLFSSLGTIVFLLLAALIFHLLNRLVEHEL